MNLLVLKKMLKLFLCLLCRGKSKPFGGWLPNKIYWCLFERPIMTTSGLTNGMSLRRDILFVQSVAEGLSIVEEITHFVSHSLDLAEILAHMWWVKNELWRNPSTDISSQCSLASEGSISRTCYSGFWMYVLSKYFCHSPFHSHFFPFHSWCTYSRTLNFWVKLLW